MATLKINGDTSGYVELVAKPVAGSTSIRLDKIVVANSSGDVGIGTSLPSSKLNLYDPTAAVLEVSAFNNWVGLVAGIENPPQIRWKQGWSLGFGPATHATGADPLNFNGTGYDNKMTISNGGNVGIGTNNPLNKFVVAEANDQHGVEIAPGTLSYIQAYDRATSDYGDLSIDAQSIRFATDNGTERMRIHTGGNVGIGTDNPHQTLHVNGGAADTTIQITNSASGSAATDGFSLTVENPSGDVNIRNREATNMRFYTSNAERMRIASNGMVQVGGVTNDSGGTKFKVGGSGNDGEITLHADTTASYITAYDRTAGLYHPIISTASEHQLTGGYVTMPSQPAFVATNAGSQTVAADAKISFTSAGVNVGSNFSTANDRFTAPVSGRYFFNFTASISNMSSTGTYLAIYFKKNGAGTSHRFRTRAEDVGNEWTGIMGTAIMDLSSGDYIEANGYNHTGNFTMQGGEYLFGGYLIG